MICILFVTYTTVELDLKVDFKDYSKQADYGVFWSEYDE